MPESPQPPQTGQPTFPAAAIANLLGITERRLQQLVNEGAIPKPEARGRYYLVQSVQGYIEYLKRQARDNTRGTATGRLAVAQATRVEMENFRRAGELVYESQVGETLNLIASTLATQHEGMPGRLAAMCAGKDAGFIRSAVQGECRAIRDALSLALTKRADALETLQDSGVNTEAGAAEDAGALG